MNTQFKAGTVAARILELGQEVFESKGNKQIAEILGIDNQGQVANGRRDVALATGWKKPGKSAVATPVTAKATEPRARKSRSGSFPSKIEGFLESVVEEVPDVWEPCHVIPIIEQDSTGWNRFIRRLNDLDPKIVESFEVWLGHPATIIRMAEFMVAKEAVKIWENKDKAMQLANQLVELGYGDKTPQALLREIWL